jgi:twitching motility protein PilJ
MASSNLGSWFRFSQMKVWQKCALIAAPFTLPIAALLYLVIAGNNENIATAKAEVKGLEYLRPLKKLSQGMATHRGLTNRLLNGDKTAIVERNKAAQQIEEAFREFETVDATEKAGYKIADKWTAVKDGWRTLLGKIENARPEAAFDQHSEMIAKVIEVSTDVWEFSTLALDPVADTYYLQDVMIARGIQGMEDLGQLRGLTAGLVARLKGASEFNLTKDEKVKLTILAGTTESARTAIEKETKNAIRANATLKGKLEPLYEEYVSKTDAFLSKVRPILAEDAKALAAINPGELFNTGTEAIGSLNKLYDGFDPQLVELLNKRAASYRQTNYLSVLGTIIGLLAVTAVSLAVTRSLTMQINNLTRLFDRVEIGDYSKPARVLSSDELGHLTEQANATLERTTSLIQSEEQKDNLQRNIMKLLDEVSGVADGDLSKEAEVTADATGAIADSFNFMIAELRKVIGNVQNATLQVSSSANEIYTSAEHLADGSESQSEQIVNTSAAIDEMAVSIQQVSENAATSTTVAQQALSTAKQGNVAVRNTIEGMNKIREQAQETAKRIKRLGETSQEIGQIVQLIDDIADRTSILALNASIQAAAAGEAGRGFAVVAEEVERLAVRSTEATRKIATLVNAIQSETNEAVGAMEKNIQEVVSGSKVANQAGQSLNEIESVSLRLSELIQSISLASKQQARGSEALAKSMGDISNITQQTAAGTKQTAESVNALARLADDLRGSVSRFKLPSGYGNKA